MAGLTVAQLGFHPVFSITWAGTRLSKSICQSANVVLNFTVTVCPPFDPATESMSRYPAMLVTSGEDTIGSPRCISHAYLKSAAVIATPSDQTAFGFSVYTMVSGLVFTSSDDTIRSEFGVGAPRLLTTKGLGSTAPRTVRVPGVSPAGVLGLHPVTLWVMPNEMAPPATPT